MKTILLWFVFFKTCYNQLVFPASPSQRLDSENTTVTNLKRIIERYQLLICEL